MHIPQGEAWAVIGPSGCGKTTLLYLLAGLLRPVGGRILIARTPIDRPRPQTGLVLQDHGLLPWATVEENARLGWVIRGFYGPDGRHSPADGKTDRASAKKKVDGWLERLRIDSLRRKYPAQLSRGQRQRAAIARTLSLDPDLLLMDEPFSALDAAIREDLQRVILSHQQESGITSVLVTHDIEEALFMGGRILVMRGESNRESQVMENVMAGREEQRALPGFREKLDALRHMLGVEG